MLRLQCHQHEGILDYVPEALGEGLQGLSSPLLKVSGKGGGREGGAFVPVTLKGDLQGPS